MHRIASHRIPDVREVREVRQVRDDTGVRARYTLRGESRAGCRTETLPDAEDGRGEGPRACAAESRFFFLEVRPQCAKPKAPRGDRQARRRAGPNADAERCGKGVT